MFADIAPLIAEELHEHGQGFFAEYWSILTDPAHIAVEVTLMALLDGVLLGLLWPLIRRFVDAKLRAQHEQLDREHGIHHHDDHVHLDPAVIHPQTVHADHADHDHD